MKKITAVFAAILTVGLAPVYGQDAAADLKKLDAKLTEAFKTRDFDTLKKHTAEDYMIVDPRGGVHNKTQYFKHLTTLAAKFEELKESDVHVRVFGNTGVVTGLLHVKGKMNDKEVTGEYRWTRVYNRKGDEWQCVLEQHTHVMPKMEKKARAE